MTFINAWGLVLGQSLLNLWAGFITFVPSLLGAIIIFIIGWFIGSAVSKAIKELFNALKVNKVFERTGVTNAAHRAGYKLNVGGFVGGLVKWFIVVVFLMASLEIIGLTQVNQFLREAVLYYVPKVIIASLVLIIAAVIAEAIQKIVQGSAQAANVHGARMIGSITRYAIWTFAFIIALAELGIATAFMQILFTGFVAALAIALGLAFGLGGKDAASRAVERFSNDMSSRD